MSSFEEYGAFKGTRYMVDFLPFCTREIMFVTSFQTRPLFQKKGSLLKGRNLAAPNGSKFFPFKKGGKTVLTDLCPLKLY